MRLVSWLAVVGHNLKTIQLSHHESSVISNLGLVDSVDGDGLGGRVQCGLNTDCSSAVGGLSRSLGELDLPELGVGGVECRLHAKRISSNGRGILDSLVH